jgi:acyl carrier protein phosphodiesterase
VNFLLHLHLAARDLGSPAAGAGAMLPDLWRMADRRVRARRVDTEALQEVDGEAHPEALEEVLAGIDHHLAIDRWFHADPVFLDGEREAAAVLREARLAARRSPMLAHVLWELCLDGALLRREGTGTLLDQVRRGTAAVARGAGMRAAELHHFAHVAREESARAAFAARMDRILAELARGPWIEGYRSGAGIAARLQGVRVGVGLAPMDAADLERLAEIAEALLARAAGALGAALGAPRVC